MTQVQGSWNPEGEEAGDEEEEEERMLLVLWWVRPNWRGGGKRGEGEKQR